MADKKNIKALHGFRLRIEEKGEEGETIVKNRHVAKGEVIPKSAMPKPEWQNLCNMVPPRAVETDEKVGKPGGKKEAKMPGGDK